MSQIERARRFAVETVAEPRRRRRAYVVLGLLLAVLVFFPRSYVARAKLVPQDNNSIGSMMSGFGGQLQGFAALLGGAKQPIDLYLAIGRGYEVTDDVIRRLRLVGPGGYATPEQARVALGRKIDVHTLTGGIVEIEVRTRDAALSQALASAYVEAISTRITALSRDRIEHKRTVVEARFKQASDRVATTEAALNDFRRRNRLAEPEAELGAALSLRAGLEAQLQAKQVELQTLQQFQGAENPQLQAVQSEVASLRQQIARTGRPGEGAAGPNVAGMSAISGEYLNLYRDYRFAQALYEVYARSSEEVAVETLASESASDVQVIEAPRLDSDRKYNISAIAALALVIFAALFTELYAPATGIELRRRRSPDAPQ